MKKKVSGIILAAVLLASLVGCGGKQEASQGQETTIKVGVTAGPHEEIINKVKELAAKQGIHVETVVFNDYITPNRALTSGQLDVNSYQTIPFMDQYNKDHNTKIVPIGKTVTFLMGIYSKKYKKLEDLPEGATLGLQNDPVNMSRALHVYEQAGLIKLKPGVDVDKATPADIAENPKNFQFKLLDAALLARTLNSLDASTVNSNFALKEGYKPKRDAIFMENSSRYVNYIATNEKDKDNPLYHKLVELYRSDEVKKFIEETYDGVIITSW
ncbi:MetQ/NlpA family ABC transporter substrate-binding protein [Brevibacillus sp. LEMMJ03]|jgi:D-methionine transport system substrate-binding protein|uniref:Lipoprotein n=1 Tax=Brevibacillus aydinogluensis TaxID=927786 RepID=A0AA48M4X8_9BACL|nr:MULTISPECIES: MetQ/NlpA family ABC transporter substrate-binding protein [Brevibacillus]TRY24039.1 MetQ/NlpA family ABC transporter substrate-binding protein [Brevibacillus sp. LEMMJ03]CAJ1000771.1 Lipoprotein [Brevibacillus aydinogluensis]